MGIKYEFFEKNVKALPCCTSKNFLNKALRQDLTTLLCYFKYLINSRTTRRDNKQTTNSESVKHLEKNNN